MIPESPTMATGDQNALSDYRRLFLAHVGAVVMSAALVVPLLLGVASLPAWLSVAYCVAIALVAITFVAAAVKSLRSHHELGAGSRIECLALTVGLSLAQAVFVLPVLICIYAPTLRL